MLLQLLIAVTLTLGQVTGDNYPCPGTKPTKMKLPKLADQFEVTIEANIINKNYALTMKEYFDFFNNKGALHTVGPNDTHSWFYDFKHMQAFRVDEKGNCTTKNLSDSGRGSAGISAHGGHVNSIQSMLRWGPNFTEAYMGNATVRGVLVNQWRTCFNHSLHGGSMNYSVDFFFTLPKFSGPGNTSSYPVRIAVQGQRSGKSGSKDFQHVYDLVSYKPGNISDPNVFMPPPGVFCANRTSSMKMPKLPESFSLHGEMVLERNKTIESFEEHFDRDYKVHAMMFRPARRMNRLNVSMDSHHTHVAVDDYSTGHSYVIDLVQNNCTIIAIGNFDPSATKMSDKQHIRMKTSAELMYLNHSFVHIGQRKWRNIPVEAYSAHVQGEWNNHTYNITTEAYFTKHSWQYHAEAQNETDILIGHFGKTHRGEVTVEVFEFHAGHTREPGVWDVSMCFPHKKQKRHLLFKLKGDYEGLAAGGKAVALQKGVRMAVSKYAQVAPIRVTNIEFDSAQEGNLDVWLTILDHPPHNITVKTENQSPTVNTTLDQAVTFLKDTINKGMTVNVKYTPDKETKVSAVPHTLALYADAFQPVPSPPAPAPVVKQGHSSGAMAGLGIGMLLLGAIIGLGIAVILWRRRIDIPYVTTN